MRLRVLDEFGRTKPAELYRSDLQEFADGLLSEGKDPSTIKVTLPPPRAVLRGAVARGELAVNPCDGLELAAAQVDANGSPRPPRLKGSLLRYRTSIR